MRTLGRIALAGAITAAAIVNVASDAEAKKRRHHNHTGEIIAAGIIGVVIGGALASEHSRDRVVHRRRHVTDYDYDEDNYVSYSDGFSPARGVICYEDEQVCYDRDGTYSNRWMKRLFHRRH